jgi:hypothetical protein
MAHPCINQTRKDGAPGEEEEAENAKPGTKNRNPGRPKRNSIGMPRYLSGRWNKSNGSGGVGVDSVNLRFHLVFFPAAYFLPGEEFSVVATVTWVTVIECGVINLFSYPPLS